MSAAPMIVAYECPAGVRWGVYRTVAGQGYWLRGSQWEPVPWGRKRLSRSLFKSGEAARAALAKVAA